MKSFPEGIVQKFKQSVRIQMAKRYTYIIHYTRLSSIPIYIK